ncbi:ATP-binding response regulator [Luteimonas vadosa]|uniref:histidine kinase n=1 Tax=Luteimonas vadosa TaxID=1165507 RepID=A0ABP9DY03_9GAMM
MTSTAPPDPRHQVVLLLATARDADLTRELLARSGISARACPAAAQLMAEVERGAGAVLVSEECLGAHGGHTALAGALQSQPRWSDLPVLLLTRGGSDSLEVGDALALLRNVTLLERPLHVAALVSTVDAALRARRRQYEVQEQMQQLEAARDQQVRAVQQKDEFLAMLAHELRNPLAPIRNALHVLDADDSDPARRQQLRGVMRRQVDHMVRLVDDLLEASRLSRGRIMLHRGPGDLRDALRSAIEIAMPGIEAGGLSLDVDWPDEPLPVHLDAVRIAQVFGNLLNNAAKFGSENGHIAVTMRRERNEAVVEIRDDGAGIAPDLLPRVFDLFAQGPRESANGFTEGLGIGLALVRTLVELHGGRVEAASDGEDQGATFTVRLPLASGAEADPPSESAQEPIPTPPGTRGLRVLAVDDNVDAAQTLGLVLQSLGLVPRVAHGGAEALAATEAFEPDVILLDIGMPEMDGYTVARRIRGEARYGNPVLVAVTGWSDTHDIARSTEAGFDHHLAKPVDIGQLQALLRDIASGRE